MFQLGRSEKTWWQKPLAFVDEKFLPAELVVLRYVLRDGEEGAWLNSRGTKTAVVDLVQEPDGRFRTVRVPLPGYVQECLTSFYAHPEVAKGVFDLVIWRPFDLAVRFVEVKCPHWDRLTAEQQRFSELAHEQNIKTEIVEWEFEGREGSDR